MSIPVYFGGEKMKEEQIVNAARDLFTTYGYKRVSMDEIARKAGVTKRTVYMYFKSKEELLKYFINEEIQNMKKIVEQSEDKDKSFMENVHQVIVKLIKYTRNREFLHLIFQESEAFKNTTVIENIKTIDVAIQSYIKEKLKYAVNQGYVNVKDINITAFLIYKMYVALMFEWNEQEKKIDEEAITENIMYILKNGLERREV